MRLSILSFGLAIGVLLLALACATTVALPRPRELALPTAFQDATHPYLSPFTAEDTLAEWTAQAIRIKAKGQIAGAFGTILGIALGGDPIFGSLAKSAARDAARRQAIEALGGWERIRELSSVSFDSADDLAVHLYALYSAEPTYVDALDAAMTLYPDLAERYVPAIAAARRH